MFHASIAHSLSLRFLQKAPVSNTNIGTDKTTMHRVFNASNFTTWSTSWSFTSWKTYLPHLLLSLHLTIAIFKGYDFPSLQCVFGVFNHRAAGNISLGILFPR